MNPNVSFSKTKHGTQVRAANIRVGMTLKLPFYGELVPAKVTKVEPKGLLVHVTYLTEEGSYTDENLCMMNPETTYESC